MSNDSNVSIDGEIDAGFTSYWDSDEHGQTVGGTTEDDKGTVETDIWPKGVDPKDLTEKQRKSLKTALTNPKLSVTEIADRLDISYSTVRGALGANVPDWYQNTFKNTGKSAKEISRPEHTEPGENQEKIIRIINERDGVTRKELATELGIGAITVREHIEKIDKSKYRVEDNVDGYHHRAKVYYPPDSDGEGESADGWAQKKDDKRVDQHDNQESETQETDVQEILGVLKATAVHQETKQALDVLEGYL